MHGKLWIAPDWQDTTCIYVGGISWRRQSRGGRNTPQIFKKRGRSYQITEVARQALQHAVTKFEESKTELGDQVVDVDAEEEMNEGSEGADKDTMGAALQESLMTMSAQLVSLQASAEAMVTEEVNSNKRQRTDGGLGFGPSFSAGAGTPAGSPPATASAMQPFAGKEKPPFGQPDKQ